MEFFKNSFKSVLGAPDPENQPTGADTVLEMDRTDCEIVGLALDTLCNITSPETFDEEVDKNGPNSKIGEQFTEIFIKHQDSVGLVLAALEDFDFRVRWPALKLLSNLVSNRPKDIQEIILVMPMGVSKLMDLLSDSREVIRNDALLLLIQLTKGNANIQKIVAFENAFDRIFDVITQEGSAEGGIVVEDCLLLMLNLLKGNLSNQNFFKEGTCQRIMHACGLLQALCDILMASGVPADVLTETINAVAEVIRGNNTNQEFLGSVTAPSSPPRPAIVVLLMSMVNEKQPFQLRCAVLYCFQSFLYKNNDGQTQLIQTLLPQSNETPSLTTGQLLCGGLFSPDPLSNWFSAVALSHALIDNTTQKEQLLRVLLATNIGKPPVTLMQQCVFLLQQGSKPQSKLGLLILLCRWVSYCPVAVKTFLSLDSSVAYLTALLSGHDNNEDLEENLIQSMCALLLGMCVHFNDDQVPAYTKDKLCNLIDKRIGLERFQDAIGGTTRHEIYSRTLKHPQPSAKHPKDLLLDHEFCRLLKILEGGITIQDLQSQISNLRDQNLVLRAAQTNLADKDTLPNHQIKIDDSSEELQKSRSKIQDLESQLSEYKSMVVALQEKESQVSIELEKKLKETSEELEKLKKDQEDLLELLSDQDTKLMLYKQKLTALGEKVESDGSSGEVDDDTDDQPSSN
ncbi:Similar to Uso1: General vesicular transport factor p115 (Mus musculus) [Cotesia congregata]|uniref:Similar to Uso1: General vesicular transport factor p115 (Mus musculus) n=1 Tax=Cotesia congregata TaxID=51543 RepID=A0A8J2H700_COTCN|nr:Similar to Uso1: General vesicular transport factor p115 (Mus musculus) [Cotesia congregata]